jgi:hypothetical protein
MTKFKKLKNLEEKKLTGKLQIISFAHIHSNQINTSKSGSSIITYQFHKLRQQLHRKLLQMKNFNNLMEYLHLL